MRIALSVIAACALFALHGWALWLALHPEVGEQYRGFFIDHSTDDWLPQKYDVPRAEGMEFSRTGLPVFVRAVYGLSKREHWGRWTDARLRPAVRVVFEEPFVGPLCVVLQAVPAPPQEGRNATLRIGNRTATFATTSSPTNTYRFDIVLDAPADALEIEPSAPARPTTWDPGNPDPRVIGLGLARLAVVAGTCEAPTPFTAAR